MKTRNSTKSKLLSSVIALVLCVSMLIGATFAWFTDTASTAVNKIQAGNLDVQLLGANGNSLEGQTLSWQKAAGHGNESVLWEPGCTYNLTPFKIKNNGNLALKYQISITGIVGNADLLDAIDFTVTGVTGATNAAALNGFEGRLAPNSETALITITGKMKTTAGNEYQGKSIDGIGITVRATQLGGTYSDVSGENDSFNNTYDENATYPPLASYINNTTGETVTVDASSRLTSGVTITGGSATSTVPEGAAMYSAYTDELTNTAVIPSTNGTLNRDIKTTEATADSVTYDISYNYVLDGASTPVVKFGKVVENVIDVSTGLDVVKVTHTHGTTTTVMTPADNANAKADGTYYYDSTNGKLYVWSSEYSSFKIEYKSDFEAATGGQGYATLDKAIAAANDGGIVTLMKDVDVSSVIHINKNLTLDLNGLTVTNNVRDDRPFSVDSAVTFVINGTKAGSSMVIPSSNTEALGFVKIYDAATVTLNGGIYNGNTNSGAFVRVFAPDGDTPAPDAIVTLNNVTATTNTRVFYMDTANKLKLNVIGGTFNATGRVTDSSEMYSVFGVDCWNLDTPLIFTDVTVTSAGGACVESSGCTATYTNCTFNISEESNPEFTGTAVAVSWKGTANIKSGSYTSAGYGVYVYSSGGTINVEAGTINGEKAAACASVSSDYEADSTINISGGSIAGELQTAGTGAVATIAITGGKFSSDPASYLAEGKMAVLGSDGMYTVENDPRVKTEEQLKAAIEAGGEVTLGANIPLTSTLSITKDVTLNLGQYRITGKDIASAIVLKCDSGVVKATVNATTGGVTGTGSNGDCFEMHSNNKGTVELTINGGNYSSTSAYLVDISAGSTTPEGRRDKLFINGGTYSGNRIINANPANTEIVITNGSLTGTNYGINFGTKSNNSKLTMTGGELKYENGSVIVAQASGNTIDIRDNAVVTGKLSLTNCTMNITGGTVNITGTDNRAIIVSNGTTMKIGGDAKVKGDALFNMNGGTVNITGGMFKGKIVSGLNYGNDYLQSVKDLLTDAFSLSDLNGDGWYQVVPNE